MVVAMVESDPIYMLPSDFRRLQQAIDEYDRRYRTTLAGIADASDISSETWHDNPAFDEIQQQAKMSFNQFKKFEAVKKSASVIAEPPADGRAGLGARVTFAWNGDDDNLDQVVLTGYMAPGSPEEEVSTTSPLGQLLLGAKIDDVIEGRLNDRPVKIKVHAIEPATDYF